MAKTVFRPNEINKTEEKILLKLAKNFEPEEPEVVEEVAEVYEGPTVEQLKAEADKFKSDWEIEKQKMFTVAQKEAEKIVKDAQQSAFEEIRRKTDQGKVIKTEAETEAARIIQEAKDKAASIIKEAEQKQEKLRNDAYEEGKSSGSADGFKEGKLESDRLIDRLHLILEKVMDKRQEILDETEQQIVELVLLMTRKVVKVISDNQRSVVMANVLQALKKVKGRGDVTIRVNMADVQLTTEHTKEFMQAVENVKNITIAEDSSVDRGGCIVETDFGSVDARITSQLSELEQKILEISPIKSISKISTQPKQ